MSNNWEKFINDWDSKSKTVNLEYLDLATSTTTFFSYIAHNLSVIHHNLCFSSITHLNYFKIILKENQKLKQESLSLRQTVHNLTTLLTQSRAISRPEVSDLLAVHFSHPKPTEQQIIGLLQQVSHKINKLEKNLTQVHNYLCK